MLSLQSFLREGRVVGPTWEKLKPKGPEGPSRVCPYAQVIPVAQSVATHSLQLSHNHAPPHLWQTAPVDGGRVADAKMCKDKSCRGGRELAVDVITFFENSKSAAGGRRVEAQGLVIGLLKKIGESSRGAIF